MGSSPKEQAKPDPATVSSSTSEAARKQQELQFRRRGGFYSGFRNVSSQGGQSANTGSSTGGNSQTVG